MDFSPFWSIQCVIAVWLTYRPLCAYEYCLTFPAEIRLIWKRRKSVASILFLVNRYTFLCYSGSGLVQLVAWGSDNSYTGVLTCDVVARINDICMIVMHLVLAIFAALRTYAIWDQNRVVFTCVLGLGLLFPIGDIYRISRQTYHPFPNPIPGCSTSSSLPYGLTPKIGSDQLLYVYDPSCASLLGLGSNVIFELVVVILTWTRTFPAVRQLEWLNMNLTQNVTYIIFRNGKPPLFLSAILVINLSGLPQFIPMIMSGQVDRDSQPQNLQVSDKGIVTSLIEAITSILISRFILSLRENYAPRNEDDGGTSLHIADMSFRVFPSSQELHTEERCCDLESAGCQNDKAENFVSK
ncbi:hypothetical protein BDY19DRAFT_976585 [Irpex rosettiformis]|uniref:Uncharacterized protein n=1 Tax=Irpex rosettiformis TaxID=378272 RepID=A0ACB8TNU6_9APHY|nr:hypothetical protein BDY19DRAFT_976585 [Irpex rosettiformis]